MPQYNRGGTVLKTGVIGRLNVIRQQILLPGEIMRPRISGEVRLTPLRERDSVRLHAQLDVFLTPLRWLWSDLPGYIKDGPTSSKTVPKISTVPGGWDMSDLGIGGDGDGSVHKWFHDAPLRVFNEWWRWPENADLTSWLKDGPAVNNLAHSYTRLQGDAGAADAAAEQPISSGKFDIRALAELQAKYRQAMKDEWLAHDRYISLLKELWNADGSREVDQVPMRLRGASVHVNPFDLRATDSDGLGAVASMFNFKVDHRVGRVVAGEHMILTYTLCLRLAPVAEDEVNPMAFAEWKDWAEVVGEPGVLASMRPQQVHRGELNGNPLERDNLGYLPAGWQWRSRWNCVDARIDQRNSFPILRSLYGQTRTTMRDASRVGDIFLSASLGDYQTELNFDEPVDSPIPGPKSSLFSGVGDAGKGSAYPYPGPRYVS